MDDSLDHDIAFNMLSISTILRFYDLFLLFLLFQIPHMQCFKRMNKGITKFNMKIPFQSYLLRNLKPYYPYKPQA